MNPIQIGRLNKRITFLTYVEVVDELGQNKQQLQEVKTVWGDIYPVRGAEKYEADRLREEVRYKCYVRYFKGLNASNYYLVYDGEKYKLESVIDMDAAKQYYEIYCTKYVEKEAVYER